MKTWLITGCSSGIGRGIAWAALKTGDRVVATARSLNKLMELTKAYPKTAVAVKLDVQSSTDVERVVRLTKDCFDSVDVLVNNAGYG